VIDGPDAGRQKQPFRRVGARHRIEDDRARDHLGMTEALLDMPRGVGAAGAGRKFARRQGCRDRDHTYPGRLNRRALGAAVRGDLGAVSIELLRCRDAIAEAQADHLRRIGDRATAQGDDQIGASLARPVGCGHDVGARRMRADRSAQAGKAVAKHLLQPLDEIGLARERAACQHEYSARVEAVDLLRQRVGEGSPEDDAFHQGETINAA
jgi:hypothetical protein